MTVDAFMFYNEFDVLELRLELLDKYVDTFVLVESEVTHVGGPKPLYFQENKERYAKWLPKIRHVIVTAAEAPKEIDPWHRETHQRHCILKGLEGIPDDEVVLISDVDEIPDLSKFTGEELVTAFHMHLFIYSLDYITTIEEWIGTVATSCAMVRKNGPNVFRQNRWRFPRIQNAGWHLSYFGDAAHVHNKLKTFAHALDDNGHRHLQTPDNIKDWIGRGVFVDGKTVLTPRPPEVPLPGSIEVLRRLHLGTFP
jgi:beta-1,4-mannosyl-glycoprotein beta-1,4-N-acetylglucosaminyltransferase